MKKLFLLPGYACTPKIWEPILASLHELGEVVPVSWPVDRTPGFICLADVSDWLYTAISPDAEDVIIGHSMGGLAALDGAARFHRNQPMIILFESFLCSPRPFFQNLMMPDTDPTIFQGVMDMMAGQRSYYSKELQTVLRIVDLFAAAITPGLRLAAVYGDRGCNQPDRVKEELAWPRAVYDRVPLAIVGNSCHFPSLENPAGASAALRSLILSENTR